MTWWCAVHNAQGRRERSDACLRFGYPNYAASCDMRSAVVLVRDADGNWPAWALQAVAVNTEWLTVSDILDVMAEAAK